MSPYTGLCLELLPLLWWSSPKVCLKLITELRMDLTPTRMLILHKIGRFWVPSRRFWCMISTHTQTPNLILAWSWFDAISCARVDFIFFHKVEPPQKKLRNGFLRSNPSFPIIFSTLSSGDTPPRKPSIVWWFLRGTVPAPLVRAWRPPPVPSQPPCSHWTKRFWMISDPKKGGFRGVTNGSA